MDVDGPAEIRIEEMIDNSVGGGTRNGYIGDNLYRDTLPMKWMLE